MKATFTETAYFSGKPVEIGEKTIELPFSRISARAIIIRRRDGAILGVRHQAGRGIALPGGGIEEGEAPPEAVARELSEEGITLIDPDNEWQNRFGVDYYPPYGELSLWYVITVKDTQLTPNPEIFEWLWVPRGENPWYSGMGDLIALVVEKYFPEFRP